MKNRFLSLIYIIVFITASPLSSQTNLNGLILNYEFKDATGSTTVKDSSPLGNHGVIKGTGATILNGILTLPGGSAGSSAAYIQLPTGMFDKQNTLTISLWLKNGTGSGNYAAMFFGTSENLPSQYWLLNPANSAGLFKSVVTNSVVSASPWTSEYGFSPSVSSQGMLGSVTNADWGLYTTVIKPTSITAYYNGSKIGEVAITRTVNDFGNNLVAYIGRSSYGDKFYKGSVKQVKVYATALSDSDVRDEYLAGLDPGIISRMLEEDKSVLSFPESEIIHNLTLPVSGKNGSHILWASSDIASIDENGTVTRNASVDRKVLLTATFSMAGQTVTKSFVFNVLASQPEKDLQYILDKIDLGISYVTENISLPLSTSDVYPVTWTSSNNSLIDGNGKVSRPAIGLGDQEVTLTATVSNGNITVTKKFTVTVAEDSYGYLMSYILSGGSERTNSLFIASSPDGQTYTALNNGKAIVYPLKGTKKFRFPWLFRKPDGTFGMIASDNNLNGIIVYNSPDLVNYTDETYLALNTAGINVQTFLCKYDNSKHAYSIKWQGANNKYYEIITKDFKTIDSTVETAAFSRPSVSGTTPTMAVDKSLIALTKKEYDNVVRKYGKITNTGIAGIASVHVPKGGQLNLPDRVTTQYSDGSTKQMGVTWNQTDIDGVNLSVSGSYVVNGVVQQPDYTAPLIRQRADPYIAKGDDGYYYFTASYPMTSSTDPEGYDRVVLRRATTIAGLATAQEITIWDEKNATSCYRYVWAPEIHQINGNWFVFFTTSTSSSNVWNIRPRVISCNLGAKDPFNPDCWEKTGHLLQAAAGDIISFTDFSLDMTSFENKGKQYVVWAQIIGHSSLAIATVDNQQPWISTSKYTLLTSPEYAWEWDKEWVNEGPAVIKNNGKIYVAFSASSVNSTYCVGMMYADENSDLLNINSWTKVRYPLLTTSDLPVSQTGPGHNSFTIDQYGNPVIVYHARNPQEITTNDLYDPGRHAFVKSMNFTFDGTPVVNMTKEQELAPANKNVTVEVVVE
jgi:GH43 family beta-xylosidase